MSSFARIDFRTADVQSVDDPAARRPLLLAGEALHRQLRPALLGRVAAMARGP